MLHIDQPCWQVGLLLVVPWRLLALHSRLVPAVHAWIDKAATGASCGRHEAGVVATCCICCGCCVPVPIPFLLMTVLIERLAVRCKIHCFQCKQALHSSHALTLPAARQPTDKPCASLCKHRSPACSATGALTHLKREVAGSEVSMCLTWEVRAIPEFSTCASFQLRHGCVICCAVVWPACPAS